MALTYTKDIPDFITKVKQVTDISELETTVSQLNASLVTVQGDVEEVQGDITTLAGALTTANEEIDDIWDSNDILGAKNLLVYPYKGNYTFPTTINELTVTDTNGVITVNGTASDSVNIHLSSRLATGSTILEPGSYILSGCPNSGTTNLGYSINIDITEGESGTTIATSYGDEVAFTLSEATNVQYRIYIRSGTVCTNLSFSPMIRPASYQDSSYVPYAMTNKDITDIVKCNETTDGTYTLKATVSSGVVTYAWTADT